MVRMDVTPYVERLRQDLIAAAEAAAPEVREAVERLTYAIDPSARLALMEAISQAAAEITAELPSGGVEVRLAGRDLEFAVQTVPDFVPDTAPLPATIAASTDDNGPDDTAVARFTLRLPESLKTKAEEAAERAGHSLNTWLVTLIRTATHEPSETRQVASPPTPYSAHHSGGRRLTGWL